MIHDSMPPGYRWATAEETEAAQRHNIPLHQVRVGPDDQTDLIVPVCFRLKEGL